MGTSQNRAVAFLDILGFSERLSEWDGSTGFCKLIESALVRATSYVGGKYAIGKANGEDWGLSRFSDCACISQPLNPLGIIRLIEGISLFQRVMIDSGFLVRGAVSFGLHYESKKALVSKGLHDAYNLEKREEYPRVVVSEKLYRYITEISDISERHEILELLTLENQKHPFVCHLNFEEEDEWLGGECFYQTQHKLITDSLTGPLPSDVKRKYLWLAEFHNWSLWETARLLKLSGQLQEDNVWWFSLYWVKGIEYTDRFVSALLLDQDFSNQQLSNEPDGVNWVKDWPNIFTDDDEPDVDAEPDDF